MLVACLLIVLATLFCSAHEIHQQDQVQRKVVLTIHKIDECLNNVRGAVTMAYPEGLPEWDLARIALEDPIDKLKVRQLVILCCVKSS